MIARRVAHGACSDGMAVNLGFGISANVPRILLEEGQHGEVTWVIEQGAVGGVPLLDFAFGCASNADAFMPSPHQFTYFQGGGFDASLLSFLQIDRDGSVNVSKLSARPHVTAGAGGFVDITARAKKIVFSGFFNAGAKLSLADGRLRIEKEGKVKKLVDEVEHVSFSGRRARRAGPGHHLRHRALRDEADAGRAGGDRDRAGRRPRSATCSASPNSRSIVADDLKTMRAALFADAPIGLLAAMAAPRWRRRMSERARHLRAGRRDRHRHAAPAGKVQRARHPDAARRSKPRSTRPRRPTACASCCYAARARAFAPAATSRPGRR